MICSSCPGSPIWFVIMVFPLAGSSLVRVLSWSVIASLRVLKTGLACKMRAVQKWLFCKVLKNKRLRIDGSRLESVLTSKASRGFESPSFRRLDGHCFSPHDNLHIFHSIFSNIMICCTRHTFPASGVSPRACYRYISLIFGRLTVEILVLKQNCIFLQHVFSHQKNGNAHTYQ